MSLIAKWLKNWTLPSGWAWKSRWQVREMVTPGEITIGEMPETTEAQFRQNFDAMRKWRPERRTWVVKAYCSLSQGKVVVECETPEQQSFEAWLQKTGWKVDHICRVDLIHEAGAIWPV